MPCIPDTLGDISRYERLGEELGILAPVIACARLEEKCMLIVYDSFGIPIGIIRVTPLTKKNKQKKYFTIANKSSLDNFRSSYSPCWEGKSDEGIEEDVQDTDAFFDLTGKQFIPSSIICMQLGIDEKILPVWQKNIMQS